MSRRVCACGICENVNLPSACVTCVNYRLLEKRKKLKKLSRTRDSLRKRVDAQLKAKHEADMQRHWSATHIEKTAKLKEGLQDSENELQRGKMELTNKQQDLDSRSKILAVALAQLTKKKVEQLSQFRPDHDHVLEYTSISSELQQTRRAVIRQLGKVFPLKRMLSSNVQEREEGSGVEYWTICGARLPIVDDPYLYPKDHPYHIPRQELGASLGYMVQLLNLVADYLSAPILHSARFAGSASRIWQRCSYWDAHSFCSDEYPLCIPQNSCTLSEEHCFPGKGTSILGFSTIEDSGNERLEAGTSKYRSKSLQSFVTPSETQKGIKLLKRSMSCVSTYGFNQFLSSVPSSMSTYQDLADLLTLLSSKEGRIRSSRSLQHQISNPAECVQSSSSTMKISKAKELKRSLQESFAGINSFLCVGADIDQMEFKLGGESVLEGWNMVEHPTLPPPPSHSEDVEHWMRAMFVDAK